MATSTEKVRYLLFDVESVADGELVSKLKYSDAGLTGPQAVRRFRDELLAKYESDFIPYTFQIPISIVVAKVAADYRLLNLVALDEPLFRPHVVTQLFWKGWERYKATLVTFNGRTFDLPLLELAAFRFGVSIKDWFNASKSYANPRNRYNVEAHLDLHDLLTNFGASRFNGGLNLAANLLGKPGKMEIEGYMVQDLYEAGQLAEITEYCRCDVIDTYFVFLRTSVMTGQITLKDEQELVTQTKDWLEERSKTVPAFAKYLSHWGDWTNPW
jgi:predicted PolB exonuclease-like 3'-5' exonuclease